MTKILFLLALYIGGVAGDICPTATTTTCATACANIVKDTSYDCSVMQGCMACYNANGCAASDDVVLFRTICTQTCTATQCNSVSQIAPTFALVFSLAVAWLWWCFFAVFSCHRDACSRACVQCQILLRQYSRLTPASLTFTSDAYLSHLSYIFYKTHQSLSCFLLDK